MKKWIKKISVFACMGKGNKCKNYGDNYKESWNIRMCDKCKKEFGE